LEKENMKLNWVWMSLVLSLGVAVQAEENPMRVFILAGQSNMRGQGVASEVPAERLKADGVEWFANPTGRPFDMPSEKQPDGAWKPVWECDVESAAWMPFKIKTSNIGPEVSFVEEIKKAFPDSKIGILKFSVNGSNLNIDWMGRGHRVCGKLFPQMLDALRAAGKDQNIEWAGMLWMQGESDSKNTGDSNAYADNLKRLINEVRETVGAPEMPFVAGRVNPPEEKYSVAPVVRQALEASGLPNCGWVDCDDLPKKKDNLHYDTEGQLELGRRFAEKIKEM